MDIDSKQLAAFVSVVSTGSFKAAASDLNLTLAAISLRVKALETSLGQRLLVRGKQNRPTATGRALMNHHQQLRMLEADLAERLSPEETKLHALEIAINADSITSWFLPGIKPHLDQLHLQLHLQVDDQEHTLALLKHGDVAGCVTTQKLPVAGCVALPLGSMRYRCVATPEFRDRIRGNKQTVGIHQLLAQPAICFNRKDGLQDAFLMQHFGLKHTNYPRHYVPAIDAYHYAILNSMGWGMQSTIQDADHFKSKRIIDLFPGRYVDVALYWQHWARETSYAARLTQAIKKAAAKYLIK